MGLSLGHMAEKIGATLLGDPALIVERVATLAAAETGNLSFFTNRRYLRDLEATGATAVIIASDDVESCPCAALVVENPYLEYARAAALLNPPLNPVSGLHPAASVSPEADVRDSAWIGPMAVVEAGATVREHAFVGPGCVVGQGVEIGEETILVARVTLCHEVRVGRRGLIHPGVVIGADGFGIANDDGVWIKVPQLGSVWIGDDVEIGANTTIDRGALENTVIQDGVKLDNLVQIGHNVYIGAHTAIAGCVGIAGSTRIGRGCTIGGAAGIGGHLEIADDVHLTATTSVAKSITKPGVYSSGMVVQDNLSWRKTTARIRNLDDMARRLKALENKVK